MRKPSAVALVVLPAVALVAFGAPPAHATNDPKFKQQYGLEQIGAPTAWTKTAGNGVTIAVIDSGVDVDHPDLKAKLVAGYDFADNDNNPDDDMQGVRPDGLSARGHGTHVAGIAAAVTDNGIGVAGTAPYAKIMPLKVGRTQSTSGDFDVVAVARAIRFAVDNGARVINLSLGGITGLSLVGIIESPCADAYNRGALCVVATGNDGDRPSGYQRGVLFLSVTANDSKGNHASFGQHADTQWAVSAPGVAIDSTYPVEDGSYAQHQGTSMATPFAAGVAALLFAQGLSVGEVVNRIVSTATPMGNPGVNGAGRVNAAAAVGAVAAPPTTTPAAGPSVTRSSSPRGGTTVDPFSGVDTSKDTLPPESANDDDLVFAGGPGGNTALDPAAARRPAPEVSLGVMLATLAALAVFGAGWGSVVLLRRRRAA